MLIAVAGESSNEAGFYAIPAVLAALARIGDPDLEEILKPYLASRDGVILRAAVEAYLLHAGEKAVPDPIVEAYSRIDSGSDVEAKTLLLDRLHLRLPEAPAEDHLRAADLSDCTKSPLV